MDGDGMNVCQKSMEGLTRRDSRLDKKRECRDAMKKSGMSREVTRGAGRNAKQSCWEASRKGSTVSSSKELRVKITAMQNTERESTGRTSSDAGTPQQFNSCC